MKRKLLSLLLVITLLAVTVSTGLPSILAADDNLFTNGDFADYSGGKPTGWNTSFDSSSGGAIQVVEDVKINDSLTTNAVKLTTTGDSTSKSHFYYANKIKIEKNASYTTTFWVKVKNIKGVTPYMYEPDYIDKSGALKNNWLPQEGGNIYTYSYDDGTTRVIRTDIKHSWVIAETGNKIDNSNVSMAISRVNNQNQVLTPDYPNSQREGEWLQVIHTFSTGNLAAHEAEVSYSFSFPSAPNGELWVADVKMNVIKSEVDDYYTPAINDVTLGAVSKDVALMEGKTAEISAEAFGENKFEGWFVDGNLASEEATLTFTYDSNNPPKYEARFKKADFDIDGSFETGYTNGQLLAQSPDVSYDGKNDSAGLWTEDLFKTSSKDGNNTFFIDSDWAKYGKAVITDEFAHTGKFSVKNVTNSRNLGYKITGLNKNTDYKLTFYAMLKVTADESRPMADVIITDANMSCMVKNSQNKIVERTVEAGALAKQNVAALNFKDTWQKVEINFNSKNSTEIIVWTRTNGAGTVAYLDNFDIARPPQPFSPSVNDSSLGKATSETIDVFEGAEVTVTAESVNDGQFKGWYIGEELVSSELTYTFTYAEKYKDITAKFEAGPNTLPDYSFETSFTDGQALAASPDVAYSTTDNEGLWTNDLFKTSSKDGNNKFFIDSDWSKWGNVVATTEQSHTGDFSIRMGPNARFMGYKLEGLAKDTNYTLSFYAMTKFEPDGRIGDIVVTDANQSVIVKTSDNKLTTITTESGALGKTNCKDVNCLDNWKKFSIRFNTKDSTDVILWIRAESAKTSLKFYVDDLTLSFTPKEFKPASNNSGLGKVTPNDYIECTEGQSVTVTATPYDSNSTFTGWYVGDELISEDATFTFNYEDKYQGLTAVFVGTPGTIPNGGLEYYQNGQVLASYNNNNTPKFNNNSPWYVDTTYRTDTSLTLSVTNERAHTGEKSVVNNIPYRLTGLDIEGLEPNTEYIVSFYAYITGSQSTDGDSNPKVVSNAFILPKGKEAVYLNDKGNYASVSSATGLGALDAQVNCWDKWEKVEVLFTTTDDVTDVTLWVNFSGKSAKLYMDDFVIYKGIKGSYSADLGGTVSANFNSKNVPIGSEVTVSATPLEGNTFVGWFDMGGTLISNDANYTFVANDDFVLLAKFDGYNKPATDLFAMNGKDGTFENGEIPGWFFKDTQYPCDWCGAGVTNMVAYEGSKSLMINARYRNSLLPLTGLVPNSTYRLSFYINQPDTNDKAKVDSLAIIGEQDEGLSTAGTIFTSQKLVASNSGWNRIDMYFNSGANTAATFAIRFNAETLDGFKDRLYIDNLSLYRYASNDDILNGGLDDGKSGWIGDGTVVTEADNNALALNKNESVYQNVAVKDYSAYTVSFKAKGKVLAAAQDLAKFDVNIKNFISSKSYVEVDGTEWTKYFYKLYTGVHKSVNVALKALEDGAMIDDLSIVKEKQTAGSVVEYIDFESERFDLTSATDTSVYSLYTATDDNDPYVYSGRRALKFTYNELLDGANNFFNEAYLSYQPGIGNSIKVSMKVKIVEGKQGGFVGLAPEYSGTYGADTGFEHMSKTAEWQSIAFYVNNTTYAVFKAKINSVAGSTAGDFYVDDIVIEITPPMVMEENAKITYCEHLYNAVKNEGFESPASNKDWGTLPSTAKIVKGNALKGEKFLRAEGGTHYVIPVTIQPNKEYYFAASVRGTAKTVGSIGITLDSKGTEYYLNRDDEIASVVEFDSENTGWKRSAFKFTTDGDVAYLTIDVKEGALDIDSVMLFTSEYGYRFDPNDYTNYVPYDYDNLKSASTVINGGYGDQPYYKGPAGETGDIVGDGSSPSTGDSLALPVITIVLAVVASAVLMLIRKRKEGAENA
ncbi:MAG: hypothetical protein E7551_00170 [Ruminococcaceae bacterium]|nr:hypothetical protein [Oscillospiraceae bacterium]